MKIKKIEICRVVIPFQINLKVSFGEMAGGDNLVVRISTDEGIVGLGESSPFPYITGDTVESNLQHARTLASQLIGRNPLAINNRMNEIYALAKGQPSLQSAFDMALYDIAAQRARIPLYMFLGGENRHIWTDYTVGLHEDVSETLEEVDNACRAGFKQIKLKVGRKGSEDVEYISAVRELIGSERELALDCNQGWDYDTALTVLSRVANLNICHCEEPLRSPSLAMLAKLRSLTKVPICLDEQVCSEQDALRAIRHNAVDLINIKLGRVGGIHRARKINEIAEANGIKCMVGCFAESRLGLAAAAHFSISSPNVSFYDLDSAYQTSYDPVVSGFSYDVRNDGAVVVPELPGLGIILDEQLLSTCEDIK